MAYLEVDACSEPCETLTRHIHKPDMQQFVQVLFRQCSAYLEPCAET